MDEKAIRRKGCKDGQKAGVETGKAEGRVEGREEERRANAKKMKEIVDNLKELKMSNEQICQILNITQKELEKLIKK